jgi:hypothetical protein
MRALTQGKWVYATWLAIGALCVTGGPILALDAAAPPSSRAAPAEERASRGPGILEQEYLQVREASAKGDVSGCAELARRLMALADSVGPGHDRDLAVRRASCLLLDAGFDAQQVGPVANRTTPSLGLEEYVSNALAYAATLPQGVDDPRAIMVLLDLPMGYMDAHGMLGTVYSRAYGDLARVVLQRATSAPARAKATALLSIQAMQTDWAEACSLATRVSEIERDAECSDVAEAQCAYDAMATLESQFARDLERWHLYCTVAVRLLKEREGRRIEQATLGNADELWAAIAPHLPAAILECGSGWQDPDLMDLRSNRLTSVPGFRIDALGWRVDREGREVPQLDCCMLLWEDHEYYGSTVGTPWYTRLRARIAALSGR